MAYTDTNTARRTDPVSLSVALGVNALVVLGVIMAAPDVIEEIIYPPTGTYDVPPEKPKPIEKKERSEPEEHATKTQEQIWAPPAPLDHSGPKGGFTTEGGEITLPGTGIDPGPDPIVPPIIEPVFVRARPDPRHSSALQPAYPPGRIREGIEGFVTVKVLIGSDGRVRDLTVIEGEDELFVAATRKQALSKWRFIPATRDGIPIESWREMTVRFQMPED